MSDNHVRKAAVNRVAARYVRACMRTAVPLPPNIQRVGKTIGRLWMSGDHEGSRKMLHNHVSIHLDMYKREVASGKDGAFPLAIVKWFITTAPIEMDTKKEQARLPRDARTAGEVRFIKDRGGDHNEWGWNPPGANEREIDPDYEFNPKNLKPLAQTLRSALMALGHIQTARSTFTRIRSQRISPDGNIGGKGYVMPIKDIRKQLANCDEALSSVTDSIYDEMEAVHWHPDVNDSGGNPRERQEVKQIMDDVDEIRDDPKEWAEGEESEMSEEGAP